MTAHQSSLPIPGHRQPTHLPGDCVSGSKHSDWNSTCKSSGIGEICDGNTQIGEREKPEIKTKTCECRLATLCREELPNPR